MKSVWNTEVPSGSLGLVLWHIVNTSKNVLKLCIVLIKISAFITKVMLTANAALVWSVSVECDIQYYFPFGQHKRCCWLSVGKKLLFPVFLLWKISIHHRSCISCVFSPEFCTKTKAAAFIITDAIWNYCDRLCWCNYGIFPACCSASLNYLGEYIK